MRHASPFLRLTPRHYDTLNRESPESPISWEALETPAVEALLPASCQISFPSAESARMKCWRVKVGKELSS